MNTRIRKATSQDKQAILALYQSQIGSECCPWSEDYPSMEEIEYDLSRESLFVMKNEEDAILAAISIDLDEEVEKLSCWTKALSPGGELSRLAVAKNLQNKGIAREMLQYGMKILKENGYKSVHFLVNKTNQKAIRSYSHMNFSVVGECFLYEQPFLCYEKALS